MHYASDIVNNDWVKAQRIKLILIQTHVSIKIGVDLETNGTNSINEDKQFQSNRIKRLKKFNWFSITFAGNRSDSGIMALWGRHVHNFDRFS